MSSYVSKKAIRYKIIKKLSDEERNKLWDYRFDDEKTLNGLLVPSCTAKNLAGDDNEEKKFIEENIYNFKNLEKFYINIKEEK